MPPAAITGQARLRRWAGSAAADPGWAIGSARAVLRARYDLRRCSSVGAGARLFGRCTVRNWGTISVGDRLLMYGAPVRCDLNAHAGGILEIGDGVFINYGTSISAHVGVSIGDGTLIGQYAIILDCDYHDPSGSPDGHGAPRPVVIGEGAWLGARVTVLKGAVIGARAVIGAGSVVTGNIPPGSFAAGVPAGVIRRA